jgi:hypothetical protein
VLGTQRAYGEKSWLYEYFFYVVVKGKAVGEQGCTSISIIDSYKQGNPAQRPNLII